MKFAPVILFVGLGLTMVCWTGCNRTDETAPGNEDQAAQNDRDHDDEEGRDQRHGDHEHGPAGGMLFSITPDDMRGEIVPHSVEERISIHLLQKDSNDPYWVDLPSLTARLTQGREHQEFVLEATNVNEEGLAYQFTLLDEGIAMAYANFGLELEFEVDGTTYTASIPKDPH